MVENSSPANGPHTTDGVPHGATSLTPHLVVSPAAAAIEFYRDVLGASVDDVTRMGEVIAHADLRFERGGLTLSDPMPAYGLVGPDRAEEVTYSLALYVSDVDGVVARAVDAGSRVREPAATFVSGDRFASIVDPFGLRWTLMTRVEDLSPEESKRRVADWAASQAASQPET